MMKVGLSQAGRRVCCRIQLGYRTIWCNMHLESQALLTQRYHGHLILTLGSYSRTQRLTMRVAYCRDLQLQRSPAGNVQLAGLNLQTP